MLHRSVNRNGTRKRSHYTILQDRLCRPQQVGVLLLIFFFVVEATLQFSGEDNFFEDAIKMLGKRPARLSYFRAPDRSGYTRGRSSMPWVHLPNTNCLRKHCRSDSDCCRRHSKCNEDAHVCHDCWYGYPCRSNKDCCARYPVCNFALNSCGK